MSKVVDRAVNAIIRPPRKKYDQSKIPLFLKGDDSKTYIRLPLNFVNKRNIQLVGSYYYGSNMDPNGEGPCVIYLHGNASSQLEGQFLVPNLCKYGIFVYCFDFAGCGCSGGDYVSLGYFEKEDTEFIINQLYTQLHKSPFILWGRSMGAATTLLIDHPLVSGRISDSSFTSIPGMCETIALSYHLSYVLIPAAIWILKQQVIKKAKFDITSVSPITVNYKHVVPAIFGHAENDQFIPFEHCRSLYNHYPSRNKDIIVLNGGHSSRRTKYWISYCIRFILDNFSIDVENLEISTNRKLQENVFHFSSFGSMMNEFERENKPSTYRTGNDDKNEHHHHQHPQRPHHNIHHERLNRNDYLIHHRNYKHIQNGHADKESNHSDKTDTASCNINNEEKNKNKKDESKVEKPKEEDSEHYNPKTNEFAEYHHRHHHGEEPKENACCMHNHHGAEPKENACCMNNHHGAEPKENACCMNNHHGTEPKENACCMHDHHGCEAKDHKNNNENKSNNNHHHYRVIDQDEYELIKSKHYINNNDEVQNATNGANKRHEYEQNKHHKMEKRNEVRDNEHHIKKHHKVIKTNETEHHKNKPSNYSNDKDNKIKDNEQNHMHDGTNINLNSHQNHSKSTGQMHLENENNNKNHNHKKHHHESTDKK